MDYPATQMFFNDDDGDEEEEEDLTSSLLGAEKDAKVGILVVDDSVTYPVRKGVNKIGRIESCSIIIDHNTISKEHAEIEAGSGSKSVFISDLGSLNKTKLNDAVLRPRRMYQLQDGDVLRFGLVQAIFKSEGIEGEKAPKAKLTRNDFIIPETPVSAAKETHVIIPGTPDLSFEDATMASRSSTEGNNSSNISLIAGTQQEKKRSDTSGLMVCDQELDKGEISIRSESTPKINRKNPANEASIQDISDLDTQTDSLAGDSDEENIFEMMTQQSNVDQEKTQEKLVADNATSESHFPSISDLETQKFSTDATPKSRYRSINDLETQKFATNATPESRFQSIDDLETQKFVNDVTPESRFQSISDLETQKFGTNAEVESHSRSINGLETQKLVITNVAQKTLRSTIGEATEHSITDAETQKCPTTVIAASDDDDSETDEEGLFANSNDGTDIFEAPTQLITSMDKEGCLRQAALEISSDNRECDVTKAERCPDPAKEKTPLLDKSEKDESIEAHVDNQESPVEPEMSSGRSTAVESVAKNSEILRPQEGEKGEKAVLNDSIECKLNNMFDDVNESVADEPTQMLTQHLERILESTQVDRPAESKKDMGKPLEDGDANSESNEALLRSEKDSAGVFEMPEILSTQELFDDLPFVKIRGTPKKDLLGTAGEKTPDKATVSSKKKSNKRELNRLEAAVEVAEQEKGQKSPPKKLRGTKVAESSDLVIAEAPKISKKNTVSKIANKNFVETKVEEIVAVIHAPTKGTDRRKLRGSEGSSTHNRSLVEEKGTSPAKTVSPGKKLPPKKRGFPISECEELPAGMESPIVMTIAESPKGMKRPRMKKSEASAKSEETLTSSSAVTDPEKIVIATPRAKATRGTRLRAPSSMIRVDYAKSDSPTPMASVPVRKGSTRSQDREQKTSVVVNSSASELKNEPEKPGASRRLRKKALEKLTVPSDEELAVAPTPAKRSKQSKSVTTASAVADPPARPETPVISTTRGRGKRKEKVTGTALEKNSEDSNGVETTEAKNVQSKGNGISAQGSRVREKANNAKESPHPSSDMRLDTMTQSSLESQEIQAILSEAEISSVRTSRFSFRSSLKVEKRIESDNDKPAAKPVIAAKKRGGKISGNQTTIREFLKPKAESIIDVDDSPRTRGRSSIRGRRVDSSRTVAQQPGKKENTIEEVGRPKRGKKSAAESVTSSDEELIKVSPLRRGRSSIGDRSPSVIPLTKTKHKILFTGLNDPQLTSAVSNLGGTVTEKPSECTALVTDKVRRTYKFLCAMAMAVPIVPVDWLKESERKGRFLETRDFLLQDPAEEAKFNFNLCRSLEMAKEDRLLEGYTVVLTANTAPPPTPEMKGIIQACGGKALVRPPTTWPDKSLVISRQEDLKNAKKIMAKAPSSVPLVSVEFILTGVLRHELNFKEHKLEI